MGGKPSVPEDKLSSDRTFIVTGANTGIGYETAKRIAQLGGRVIIACRSEQKANDALGSMKEEIQQEQTDDKTAPIEELNIQYMNLDLSSLASTIDFVRRFKETGLPLHVLVCNAGALSLKKAVTEDGFEHHFQVNYLSHFLLTLLLLPLLKESAPKSRIINVSSIAHQWGEVKLEDFQAEKSYNYQKFYGNSKLFQIMNMHSLSRAISDYDISIFTLNPGFVDTEVFREASGLNRAILNVLLAIASKDCKDGSRTSLIATLDPKYDGKTALYFDNGTPCNSSRLSRNQEKQDIVWKYSLQCLRDRLDDVILQEIGEKLENIQPLSGTS